MICRMGAILRGYGPILHRQGLIAGDWVFVGADGIPNALPNSLVSAPVLGPIMQAIHAREYLHEGDVVIVHCSHQCNVRVMSDVDFQLFQKGAPHKYRGGYYKMLPARIPVPHGGYWNTTIDLAGSPSHFQYNISYLKNKGA